MGELTTVCNILKRPTWQGGALLPFSVLNFIPESRHLSPIWEMLWAGKGCGYSGMP